VAFLNSTPTFPDNFDLIKIETTGRKIWLNMQDVRPAVGGRKLFRLASAHMGTAGYVLSRSGLSRVRELLKKFHQHPIDVVLFGPHAKLLTTYQLSPSLVIQDNALTNIGEQVTGKKVDNASLGNSIVRGRKPKPRGVRKVMKELARPFRFYWPPGPFSEKWKLSCGKVGFE
jgi:glycosyl transferase family 25